MQHRVARASRLWPALGLLLAATAAALLLPAPASSAAPQTGTDGRPRRTAAMPQASPARTQPARTTATPKPTPTPAPPRAVVRDDDDEPPPPEKPRLQAQPGVVATPTPDPNAPTAQEVGEDETITVDTQLVNLNVRVIDRYNRPVKDVRKEDFRVFDNGVLQEVQFFEQREVPISYGIVVDNSGSLRSQINQVIESSKTIIDSNREGDETFVVRFVSSDEIKIMQDWSANKQDLTDALEDMFVEGGQTAIVDAVMLSAEHAGAHKKGDPTEDKRRRALILVTDGEDRASFYKTEQLFESLRENDVQIFVIGFVNELDREGGIIRKSKREKAVDLLDKLAKETGGRAFYPNSLSDLPGIAAEITKDMRTQYVLSFKPSHQARPGEFRPIRVQIADAPGREKRIAVTRAGYTAPGAQPGAPRPPTAQRPASANRQP